MPSPLGARTATLTVCRAWRPLSMPSAGVALTLVQGSAAAGTPAPCAGAGRSAPSICLSGAP
eukprot:11120562-Alexandrium_andersonii.AAC.1